MANEKLYQGGELPGEDMGADMMEADCLLDQDVLDFLEKHDTEKPLPANKVMIPEQLAAQAGYCGPLYGYIRSDTGYHAVLGWEGSLPDPVLEAELVGFVGECQIEMPVPFLAGSWKDGALEMKLVTGESGETIPLATDIYTMQQDIFSRNSGLLETSWMDDKCAVICGCGSVGSCVALQLARAGVGRFVLVDTDCMEFHNVCRHQCSIVDVGRYKVDAVAQRVLQINPQAQVKKFYQRIQDVPKERYQEWISPETAIFIGTCDNRVGDAVACDLAKFFGVPFAALGFMTRAWAAEMYTYLPERQEICYRCAFKTQIDNSIEEERRNHLYIGEEDREKARIEPGLGVDLEFGISFFDKVVLDILNRHNAAYTPRLYPTLTQCTILTGTADRTFADPFWRKACRDPITLLHLRHSDKCRRCAACRKKTKS